MIRRPPRSTLSSSSAASDVYKRQALFGYLTFGALIADKSAGGNIMNNYPRDDTFVNVGRFGLFFHFASVFPVMSVCARRAAHRFVCMWKHVDGDGDPSTTTFHSITIEAGAIVLGSTVAAATLPGVDQIVSLIGTLFGIPLLFVLPGMIGMKVFQPPETNHLSTVSYTHLRAHETPEHLVCRLLLEKKKKKKQYNFKLIYTETL
eukprot:TRINITY_DN55909_c0_g1_i1.p1 TRINITY_DN55909_c0_g1~~TRINITY_DN55909_c0_g1_i1.p1  ORF type:complete len:205 (-),score=58.83 TRINITY_DN55909_c0_g1_i1:60-674(-)